MESQVEGLTARPAKEFYCEEHNFKTADPRKAANHIKGDLVDAVFNCGAKLVKMKLGITGERTEWYTRARCGFAQVPSHTEPVKEEVVPS